MLKPPMLKNNDYYAVLQVHPRAHDAVIAKAYRELCKLYHPDAGGSFEQMRRLNEAYEVLRDPQKRAAYDLQCGRLTFRFKKAAPKEPAGRRSEVGMPWWDPADADRPLAWVRGALEPGRNYPFEKTLLPWDRPIDSRHARLIECACCQSQVLVVFKPEQANWKGAIAWIDDQHCRECGHHAACYDCKHPASRSALEVRMQVVGRCLPLPTLWRAVR